MLSPVVAAVGIAAKDLLALYSAYKTSEAIQEQQTFQEWLTYDQAKKIRADIAEIDFKLLKLVVADQEKMRLLTTLLESDKAQLEKIDNIDKKLEELLVKPTISLEAHQQILKTSLEASHETLREVIADNKIDAESKIREIARLEHEIAGITAKLSHLESSLQQANQSREAAVSELLAIKSSLPESEFEQAFDSLGNGESTKAFEAFERVANGHTDLSFDAACVAADLAKHAGRLIKAAQLYDKANSLRPEHIGLAVECAKNHIELGNFKKAHRIVIAALEANGHHDIEMLKPDNFGAHDYGAILCHLGASEVGQGNTDAAVNHFSAALRVKDLLSPWARLQLLLGRADAYNRAEQANLAMSDYRAAAEEHLAMGDAILASTVLNNAADNQMQLDAFDLAESLYREASEKLVGDDLTTKLHKTICEGNIGNCLARNGKVAEGVKLMESSLDYFRKNPDASNHRQSITLMNLSDVSRIQGQYERAITFAEEAQTIAETQFGKLHVESITVLSRLAQCHFESGETEKAAALFKDAFSRMSTRPIARSSTIHDIAVGYSRAIRECDEQGLEGDHPDPAHPLRQSLEALERIPHTSLNGSTAMIRNELSLVLTETDPDSALIELDIAIRELSQSPILSTSVRQKGWLALAYFNKAQYYIDHKNWADALEQIEKSLELWKNFGFNSIHDFVVAMCVKSYILFRMERFDDAKKVRQQALVIVTQIKVSNADLAARIMKSINDMMYK